MDNMENGAIWVYKQTMVGGCRLRQQKYKVGWNGWSEKNGFNAGSRANADKKMEVWDRKLGPDRAIGGLGL
jgi:hypothetical protein